MAGVIGAYRRPYARRQRGQVYFDRFHAEVRWAVARSAQLRSRRQSEHLVRLVCRAAQVSSSLVLRGACRRGVYTDCS
jgi:hypothetical protein